MWKVKTVEKESIPACQHCGTNIKYVYVLENDSGDLIRVGSECASNFIAGPALRQAKGEMDNMKKFFTIKDRIDTALANGRNPKHVRDWAICVCGQGTCWKYIPELMNL